MNMIKLKPFKQSPGFCGPASLKMVMDYYGVSASESELAKIAGSTLEGGTTVAGMIKTAKHFGFKVFLKENATLSDLKHFVVKNEIPVIVRWFFDDEGHYSVVVDIDEKNIVLMDPILRKALIYTRKRKIPLKKFQKIWFDFEDTDIRKPEDLIVRLMLVLISKNEEKKLKLNDFK